MDTNDTTTYYVPMILIAVGLCFSCLSLYIFKNRRFAGFYPMLVLFFTAIIFQRGKMNKFHGLYLEDGGSKIVTICFDCFMLLSMIFWAILVFSLPQFIVHPTTPEKNIMKHIRTKSLLIWLIPVGIFVRLGNSHTLEVNKGFVQTFWDPPLLFAAQFARACNYRMFGPFYSEIDHQIVVGSFPMAEDVEFMKSKKIVGVVNMCNEWSGPESQYSKVGIEQLRLQTVDTMSPTLENLERGILFINNKLKNAKGEKIFIHCKGGIGRAATMGLAYYISKGMNIDDAFKLLKSKRSIVHSKIKEYPAVSLLEKKYSKNTKSTKDSDGSIDHENED
jgi:atypical dual specificity phosphatase